MDHVCMVVPKLEDRLPMLIDLFGMKIAGRFKNPKAGYNGVVLDVPGGGAQWEVLEPYGDDSYLVKFLNEGGSALHHVTFQVESVEAATKAMEEFGYKPFGGRAAETFKEVYLHPKDSGGVLLQFFEGEWGGG
jgi:methylmalonyl-CoA/ethylmalonyl-CoA epimerase